MSKMVGFDISRYDTKSMDINTRPKSSRLGYLDALRGFAALYVVVYHMSLVPKPSPQVPDWLSAFVSYGGSGVILFFAISGFSMCLTWGRHASTGAPFKSFYITRLFRIVPLFYLWLVLTLLRDYVFKGEAGLHSASEVVANAFFLFNFYEPFQFGIVWASWTIGVELIFYLIFPFIVTYIGGGLAKSVMFLACSIIAVLAMHSRIENITEHSFLATMTSGVGFLIVLPAFLFGVTAYYLHEWLQSSTNDNQHRLIGIILTALSASGIALIIMLRPAEAHWYYVSAACYSGLLLGFSMFKFNPLVHSTSIYFGKISYSLYLNHPNLVYILAPLYAVIYRVDLGTTANFSISVLLTLAILVPMSHLSFKLIEEPFMRLGKKILARQPGAH